ncbi:MAG: sigma-70 family RNA polymerase sigma factor [Lachnospiraceae bacterium]|nr:sigma-70 family RNA polymerase sigma factor [Lachnospiraceae bacterium]
MDKEELGGLIIRSEDSMYHIAKTLLREDADCEDAISAAIVKAFSKIHTLREDSLAKTWLIRILINECYTVLRQKKNMISLEEYPQPEKAWEKQDYSELYEALQRLPEESRICISLFYMEGYSIKEIAVLLKLSESGVKSRLARARMQIRRDMEQTDQMGPEHRLAMKKV